MSVEAKKKLEAALGKLEAAKRAADKHRGHVVHRAQQQLDSLHEPVEAWGDEVESSDGGVLQLRRYKTLLRERRRLQKITGDHAERRRAERDREPDSV